MKTDLGASLPNKPHVSTSIIARTLDGMIYTSKLVEDVPRQRNEQVLDNRAENASGLYGGRGLTSADIMYGLAEHTAVPPEVSQLAGWWVDNEGKFWM